MVVTIQPWHADIFSFLDLKKNHGNELERARDLFFGLWIPDLFMQRVETNATWSLFCPNECPGLADTFKVLQRSLASAISHTDCTLQELYERYESAGKARGTVPAQKLWLAILQSQVMLYLLTILHSMGGYLTCYLVTPSD